MKIGELHRRICEKKLITAVVSAAVSWAVFMAGYGIHRYDTEPWNPIGTGRTFFLMGLLTISAWPFFLIVSFVTGRIELKWRVVDVLFLMFCYSYLASLLSFLFVAVILGRWMLPNILAFPGLFFLHYIADLSDRKIRQRMQRSRRR